MRLMQNNSLDFPSFSAQAVGSHAGGMPVASGSGAVPVWGLGGWPSIAEQLMGYRTDALGLLPAKTTPAKG